MTAMYVAVTEYSYHGRARCSSTTYRTRYAAYVRIIDPEEHEHTSIVDDPEWPHQNSSIDPSVFFYLSRMNEGRPLLPNLQELSWTQRSLGGIGMLASQSR